MKRNITLKALSKSLNVSVSTVSKALNDSPEISVATRKKIKEIAALNNYIPNASAQNLKNKKTKKIGVVIPGILPHFFAEALNGIEETANKMGYQVMICISKDSLNREQEIIKNLLNNQVDGFIISLAQESQATNNLNHIKEITKWKIPLVLFDRVSEEINCDKIVLNEELQAELATLDLIKTGCENIIYLSGIPNTSVSEQRKAGCLTAIREHGLPERIIEFEGENFPAHLIKKLAVDKKIDGILAADELSAVITMKTLIKAGLKIPEDISVISYTNGTMGSHFIPSLSVIDQQAHMQGKISVETLLDRIEGHLLMDPILYRLKSKIIHKESTRKTSSISQRGLLISKFFN
ncbi:LacI family transcriptional regulator [Gramella jeungdoensis]|uniref:LacI family transcriptional regulator n=1 Tax=Gramella jeungdoensis TaxID=708091 RepID=A0ABT0Z6N5_9FLAO|nr:LacI family DNA-binding transcriptional regulator [Gramella jeungdoensis]MCM8570855.1 LacI family transcriptional regulator [Gramella jeungdoensis]